jgi:hypothetical protein
MTIEKLPNNSEAQIKVRDGQNNPLETNLNQKNGS